MKTRALDEFKHVALIFNNDRLCGIGYNIINISDESEHAEYRALKDLKTHISRGAIKVKRFNMVVLRLSVDKDNDDITLKMSKPCSNCQKMLRNQHLVKKGILVNK